MNTITTNASANASILAIDLGKYKSVACVHDQETGEFRFTTFETARDELQRLIGRDHPTVVIIEACLLAGWVHDLCVELGSLSSRVAKGIVRRLAVTKGPREGIRTFDGGRLPGKQLPHQTKTAGAAPRSILARDRLTSQRQRNDLASRNPAANNQ